MSRRTTAEEYRFFASAMARGSSPLYEQLALGVAGDAELIGMLDGLPPAKRQPNLLFAAARHVGGTPDGYARFRDIVLGHRDAVVATMLARRTQTNEPGRCAALYPALAALPQPLALLEVGASAGLCLLPDRYAYEYTRDNGTTVRAGAADGAPRLHCRVEGAPPAVGADAVRVAWRAGIDLNPLDVTDEDDVRWLRTLVWPEQLDRLARLDAALEVARRDPPRVVAGDLNARLDELVAEAGGAVRAGATLVVFHTAVLDYVPEPGRGAFVDRVRRLDGHWLSQEAPGVVPSIDTRLPGPPPAGTIAYVVSLDERPLAFSALHGAWLRPLA
ncbi:DUF2332 domain-containing protein [Dactylosporangium sp. NPDC000555]|uniref:DUF2332 domain-containing protein n=1 Tax=Dactylosporangium sp. NPDC000555 TaxID=3154260 RepID=UPI00332B142E